MAENYMQVYNVYGYRDVDQDPQQDIIVVTGFVPADEELVSVAISADAGTLDQSQFTTDFTAAGYTVTPP